MTACPNNVIIKYTSRILCDNLIKYIGLRGAAAHEIGRERIFTWQGGPHGRYNRTGNGRHRRGFGGVLSRWKRRNTAVSRRRSVGQYRAVDLAMFAAMLAIFEFVAVTAARRWFPNEPYTVSVVPAIVTIVLMRWGGWAAIHAVLGGAVFCRASGALPGHYIIYCIGNLASMAALWPIRRLGAEVVRSNAVKSLGVAAAVTLLMQLGRAALAVLLGHSPGAALGFFTTDVITLLFTLVIIWIVRRLDGMLEEQNHYLLRIHQQEEEERSKDIA